MVFGTSKRLNKLEETPIRITHRNTEINVTQTYKYLGLQLTGTLNMTDHLNNSIKKTSTRIHLLKRMRIFMDATTATLVYQSMIIPTLTYCAFSLYGATPPYLQQRICQLEDRAQRKSLADRFRNATLLLRNEYALTCTNVYTTRTKYVMPSKTTSPSSIQTSTPEAMAQR